MPRQSTIANRLSFAKVAIFAAIAFAVFLISAKWVLAAALDTGLAPIASEIALPTADIRVVIVRIINAALGFLGIIVVLLVLYGGYLWMTAGGDERKVETAKTVLKNSVIGLIIIILAFAITRFILLQLENAAFGGNGRPGGGGGPPIERLSGALGIGPIESHYPGRGATGVPRNINVMVTFKEPIDTATVTGDSFRLSRSAERNGPFVSGTFRFSEDGRTVVFDVADLLGSPSDNIFYTVSLSGGQGSIRTRAGEPLFSGSFGDGYLWEFQTGTFVDATPPRIVSVVPSSGRNPRNILVQINWDEAMDPTSVSGSTALGAQGAATGFGNMMVRAGGNIVPGTWSIGNEYRTAEFRTDDLCGTNSCGGNVYCLPGGADMRAVILAATLGNEPPASAGFPYDGAVDAVGNSMDGNGNGIAEGQPADSYAWNFSTDNTIDLRPPVVDSISPGIDEGNVALDRPIEITFSKIMSAQSLTNSNVSLVSEPLYEYWYSIRSEGVDARGNVATSTAPAATRAVINHGIFAASDEAVRYDYFPSITSGVKDILQNCFYPGAGPRTGSDNTGGVCTVTANQPYCCNGVTSAERCRFMPNP